MANNLHHSGDGTDDQEWNDNEVKSPLPTPETPRLDTKHTTHAHRSALQSTLSASALGAEEYEEAESIREINEEKKPDSLHDLLILEADFGLLPRDHEATKYLKARTRKLLPELEEGEHPDVRMLSSKGLGINALAFPNWTVVLSPEMLEFCGPCSQALDHVLLHELCHLTERHHELIDSAASRNILEAVGALRFGEVEANMRAFQLLSDPERDSNPLGALWFAENIAKVPGYKRGWDIAHGDIDKEIVQYRLALRFLELFIEQPLEPMPRRIIASVEDLLPGKRIAELLSKPPVEARPWEKWYKNTRQHIRSATPPLLQVSIPELYDRFLMRNKVLRKSTARGAHHSEFSGTKNIVEETAGLLRDSMHRWYKIMSDHQADLSVQENVVFQALLTEIGLRLPIMTKGATIDMQDIYSQLPNTKEFLLYERNQRIDNNVLVHLPSVCKHIDIPFEKGVLFSTIANTAHRCLGPSMAFAENNDSSTSQFKAYLEQSAAALKAVQDVEQRLGMDDSSTHYNLHDDETEKPLDTVEEAWANVVYGGAAILLVEEGNIPNEYAAAAEAVGTAHGLANVGYQYAQKARNAYVLTQQDTAQKTKTNFAANFNDYAEKHWEMQRRECEGNLKRMLDICNELSGWDEEQKNAESIEELQKEMEQKYEDSSEEPEYADLDDTDNKPAHPFLQGAYEVKGEQAGGQKGEFLRITTPLNDANPETAKKLREFSNLLHALPEHFVVTGDMRDYGYGELHSLGKETIQDCIVIDRGDLVWLLHKMLPRPSYTSPESMKTLIRVVQTNASNEEEYEFVIGSIFYLARDKERISSLATLNEIVDATLTPTESEEFYDRSIAVNVATTSIDDIEAMQKIALKTFLNEVSTLNEESEIFTLLQGYLKRWKIPLLNLQRTNDRVLKDAIEKLTDRLLTFVNTDEVHNNEDQARALLDISFLVEDPTLKRPLQDHALSCLMRHVSFEEALALLTEEYSQQSTPGGLTALENLVEVRAQEKRDFGKLKEKAAQWRRTIEKPLQAIGASVGVEWLLQEKMSTERRIELLHAFLATGYDEVPLRNILADIWWTHYYEKISNEWDSLPAKANSYEDMVAWASKPPLEYGGELVDDRWIHPPSAEDLRQSLYRLTPLLVQALLLEIFAGRNGLLHTSTGRSALMLMIENEYLDSTADPALGRLIHDILETGMEVISPHELGIILSQMLHERVLALPTTEGTWGNQASNLAIENAELYTQGSFTDENSSVPLDLLQESMEREYDRFLRGERASCPGLSNRIVASIERILVGEHPFEGTREERVQYDSNYRIHEDGEEVFDHETDKWKKKVRVNEDQITYYNDLFAALHEMTKGVVQYHDHFGGNPSFLGVNYDLTPEQQQVLQKPEVRETFINFLMTEESLHPYLLSHENYFKDMAQVAFIKLVPSHLECGLSGTWKQHGNGNGKSPIEAAVDKLDAHTSTRKTQERVAPLTFIRKFVPMLLTPGVRTCQLMLQSLPIPEKYKPTLYEIFDQIKGQSKPIAWETMETAAPNLSEALGRLRKREGGGSMYTVYGADRKEGETALPPKEVPDYAIRVRNPNVQYHTKNSLDLIEKVVTELSKSDSKYRKILPLVHIVSDWIAGELDDPHYEEQDETFRKKWDGWKPRNGGFGAHIEIPPIVKTGTGMVRAEAFVPGKNLTELSDMPPAKKREYAALAVQFFETVLTAKTGTTYLFSDVSLGNFRVTEEGNLAGLDRGFKQPFTVAERRSIAPIISAETNAQRSQLFVDWLCSITPRERLPEGIDKEHIVNAIRTACPEGNNDLGEFLAPAMIAAFEHGLIPPLKYWLLFKNVNALRHIAIDFAGMASLEEARNYKPKNDKEHQ